MSGKEDYINIALMLLSCVLAFVMPFDLFLFSYAVIGPLHYLTEISWLHQRDYFATGKKDYTVLIVICFLLTIGMVFHDLFIIRKLFAGTFQPETLKSIMKIYGVWFSIFVFTAFVGSIGFIVFKKTSSKLLFFLASLVVGYLLRNTDFNMILMGTFIPTLLHVYLFTGLFMLYGALKTGSKIGYLAVFVFVGCALSFYFLQKIPAILLASEKVKEIILKTGFGSVNARAIGLFKSGVINTYDVFDSRKGIMVQRFVAFAYTYHYLNWFSKTEIIKWHLVPKKWLITSIVIWITSVALYYYDYRTGLIALFFLSLLHVFLEFPLNLRSIMGIWDEIKTRIFKKPLVPVAQNKKK